MIQTTIEYRWKVTTLAGSFGARPCRRLRERLLRDGVASLPRSWRKTWIVQRILATPPWADFSQIRKVYDQAQQKSLETGIPHNVDHIVPLNHPRVCGLHIALNLQVLTEAENGAKSNYWCPEQGELF